MTLTIIVDGNSKSVELTEAQAAALEFATNVFNGDGENANPAEFLSSEVVGDCNGWAKQRLDLRLSAVPKRLTEMPSDKIQESEVIFQIPSTYPDGKNPLPPYVPPSV